jgi:hypothetical protein
MWGNSHVRFLGGWARAIPPGYPTARIAIMLKLYKLSDNEKQYWEAWENDDGSQTVHWGVLGTKGDSKLVRTSLLKSAENKVKEEIEKVISKGFHEIDIEDHYTLLIEYKVDSMGSPEDLAKRHR